ncbi:hypothetical protein PR003_g10964 [Phytophthora rubi]|uniref:Reverse transcriptase Ty1/copia-type domain-containing protein n=1 Tax=Phytophthora rubi TaxID=129364 RepID=A0A6A3MTP7_9STRA|nr:hypothetical protein PR002_g10487 [Phytophthora rubi]KAE9032759.1 hypothetical protein PR001_g10460 [Phytophthora rubi]KAE9339527.1 hypothetical protein PR003_g10964 [Phytophthora rubi]
MMSSLSIKDLGDVRKFLGMRVELNSDGYLLSQQISIEDLLQQHGLADANGVCGPIGEECNEAEVPPPVAIEIEYWRRVAIRDFQSLVGSLLWIACCTRPDTNFAVHKEATRQTHQPT